MRSSAPGMPILSQYLTAYAEDAHQFEQPNKLPMTFLSAGTYPPNPVGSDEGWFVRLELHTADDEFGTGTNSDIDVEIGGHRFRLDHGSEENRLLEFDDFGDGDQTWYVVGPFAQRPAEMTLFNNGTSVLDIVDAAWEDLKEIVTTFMEKVINFLMSLIGAHAEYCGADKRTWTWTELVAIADTGGEDFQMRCFVEDEGDYRIRGRVVTTHAPNGGLRASVRLTELICDEESDIDQGSNSDEPFILMLVNSPAANQLVRFRTSPSKTSTRGRASPSRWSRSSSTCLATVA